MIVYSESLVNVFRYGLLRVFAVKAASTVSSQGSFTGGSIIEPC